MIRQSQGRLVLQPPSFSFGVTVLGGSYTQQFNIDTGLFEPDRALTPLVLEPSLDVIDPDYPENSGSKTGKLVNVSWVILGSSNTGTWVLGKDYKIVENKLYLYGNVAVDTSAKISLKADYYDNVRAQVFSLEWSNTLTCRSFSDGKFTVILSVPSKMLISPFNCPDKLEISAQLMNNESEVKDDDALYRWYTLYKGNSVFVNEARDLWYISGKDSKTIVINPRCVGTVIIRCMAIPKANSIRRVYETCRLQRFYGQYMDDFVWDVGRLKFPDTKYAAGRVVVNRKSVGYIDKPTDYFDIEIFYDNGCGLGWMHVAHGDYGRVDRNLFPVDAQHKDKFGWQLRELTEVTNVLVDGAIATVDNILVGLQVPIEQV